MDADIKPRRRGRFLIELLVIVVAALLISFLLKTFVVQSYYVPSASMENTLQVNDHILVPDWTRDTSTLKRGDVIVFQDPGGWYTPTGPTTTNPFSSALSFIGLVPPDTDEHLVKRVIGLPGDTVRCCDATGHITVNGSPITEPYIIRDPGSQNADRFEYSVTVPAGMLWVLGDNRFDSADSAYHYSRNDPHYFVPETDVDGVASVIVWPITRWQLLGNYPDVFAPVGKPGSGTDTSTPTPTSTVGPQD